MKTYNKVILGIALSLLFCAILIGVFIWGYRTGQNCEHIFFAADKGYDCYFIISSIRNNDTDRLLDFYESLLYECVTTMYDCRYYPFLSKRTREAIDKTLQLIASYFEKYPSEERDMDYEPQDFLQDLDANFSGIPMPKEFQEKFAGYLVQELEEIEEERKRAMEILKQYRK